jgi:hypothetical protein
LAPVDVIGGMKRTSHLESIDGGDFSAICVIKMSKPFHDHSRLRLVLVCLTGLGRHNHNTFGFSILSRQSHVDDPVSPAEIGKPTHRFAELLSKFQLNLLETRSRRSK